MMTGMWGQCSCSRSASHKPSSPGILMSHKTTDAASALERIEWYRGRWVVEEYHKALKTGCAMEQRQLRSAQGLRAL